MQPAYVYITDMGEEVKNLPKLFSVELGGRTTSLPKSCSSCSIPQADPPSAVVPTLWEVGTMAGKPADRTIGRPAYGGKSCQKTTWAVTMKLLPCMAGIWTIPV